MKPTDKRCVMCDYWEVQSHYKIGICRCNPPTSNPEDLDKDHQAITEANDWCGSFKKYKHEDLERLKEINDSNYWSTVRFGMFGSEKSAEKAKLEQIWVEDHKYEI